VGEDINERSETLHLGPAVLRGDLAIPQHPAGLVLFAHGSGSSRHSPRNRAVATALQQAGYATFLMDLLTEDEEEVDQRTREFRFDIPRLAQRLVGALDWLGERPDTRDRPVALFGASTGAAAALLAAADRPDRVWLVISRGGRPDLAGPALDRVRAPTLLIVGSRDPQVLALNEQAGAQLQGEVELRVVPGATHLFSEPGTLEQVIDIAIAALRRHLPSAD
jgi:putative phosphoribosyl transferase